MLKGDKNGFLEIIKKFKYTLNMFEGYEGERDSNLAFVIRLPNTPLEFWVRNSDK